MDTKPARRATPPQVEYAPDLCLGYDAATNLAADHCLELASQCRMDRERLAESRTGFSTVHSPTDINCMSSTSSPLVSSGKGSRIQFSRSRRTPSSSRTQVSSRKSTPLHRPYAAKHSLARQRFARRQFAIQAVPRRDQNGHSEPQRTERSPHRRQHHRR